MARALAEAFVRVRADTSGVRDDIRKDFGKAGSDGGKSFGTSFSRDAEKGLHDSRGRLVRELSDAGGDGGKQAGNRFASAFGDSFKHLGPLLGKALGSGAGGFGKLAGGAKTATIAITGLAAAAASLNTAITAAATTAPLAGLLALLPAAAVSAATAFGTLKLATSGLSDAFGAAIAGDTDKLKDSLKDLSPAAQAAAKELLKLRPQLLGIRNSAQNALLKPLVGEMTLLAQVLAGPVKVGVAQVANQFGQAGRQVAEFAKQSKTVALVKDTFQTVGFSIRALRPALDPILQGFRALAQVGLGFLPGLAKSVADLGTRFGEWMKQISASGKAAEWINAALATLKQLGGIVVQVGGILKSVFAAASSAGSGFLGVIGTALSQLNAFLKTDAGKSALQSIFTGLAQIGQSLAPVLASLVTGIGTLAAPLGQLATMIGPILTTAVTALAPALAAIAPGLKALFDGLGKAVELVAPALLPLGKAIGQIGVAIGPLLPIVGQLVGQLVAGLAPILGQLFVALGPLVKAILLFAGALTPLIPPIAQIIVQLVSGLVPALVPIIGILGQVAGVIGQFLVSALGLLINAIVPLLPAISQMAQTIGQQLLIVLVQLSPALLQILTALLPLLPALINLAQPLTNLIVVLTPVLTLVIQLAAAILSKLLPPLVSLITLGMNLYTSLSNGAVKGLALILNVIGQVPHAITSAFSGAGSWLVNAGKNIVTGLWNGIASLGSWLYNRVWSWVKSVLPSAVKWALGIHSPSKVMAELGKFAGMGLAVGIDASATGVSRASTRLAAAAVPAIGSNGLTVAAAGPSGGAAGLNMVGLADAVASGIARAGITLQMDKREVGQIVSSDVGRQTAQRRRTG